MGSLDLACRDPGVLKGLNSPVPECDRRGALGDAPKGGSVGFSVFYPAGHKHDELPPCPFTAAAARRHGALVLTVAVNPDLTADHSIHRVGLGKAVIDIGPNRRERKPPLVVPFGTGDLRASKASNHLSLDIIISA